MSRAQLLEKLRAMPGIASVAEAPTEHDGFSYYILQFNQPIDHDNPGLGTFQQEVSLLHRSELAPAPMIVHTTGYHDNVHDQPVELTYLLSANQVSIEHRYFGTSIPVPTDWTKLTIKQMADDEHAIIAALRTIYDGAFVTTGSSKGGMTAVFHRSFYPEDVEGTVAYVAPISFGAPDPRYPAIFDMIGPESCRRAVRNLALEMLVNRRGQLEARARAEVGNVYTRVSLGAAVEAAISGFEWAFWQYFGVDSCAKVPSLAASDDEVFAFFNQVSPVAELADKKLGEIEAYYYQSYAQLGYPDYSAEYLVPHLRYQESDYIGELPTPEEPTYDSEPMRQVLDFVDNHGDHMLFIYGQWDPWTAGKFALGDAADSRSFVQPEGTHASHITKLKQGDCNTSLDMLEDWTGVTPKATWWKRGGISAPSGDIGAGPRVRPAVHTPVARR